MSKSITVEGLYPPTWIVDCIKSELTNASFLSVYDFIFGDLYLVEKLAIRRQDQEVKSQGSVHATRGVHHVQADD